MRELVGCSSDIPAVFIDACHDPEDEEEVDTFQREMSKLQSYLQTFPPYECKDFRTFLTSLRPFISDLSILLRLDTELKGFKF